MWWAALFHFRTETKNPTLTIYGYGNKTSSIESKKNVRRKHTRMDDEVSRFKQQSSGKLNE